MPEKKQDNSLSPVPSQTGQIFEDQTYTHDAVFGEITEEGPNYRNVGWLGSAALMMKSQIGLGVLSIPVAFDTLGIVPGVIILCTIACITTWSDYMVGVFKMRHRDVYGIDDAGGLMFGRIGKIFFGSAFCLYWVFVAGSGMLSISIAVNALSTHGTCTAVFVAVAAIVGFMLSSIQTLGRMGPLAWIGLVCIITGIMVVTIAVGVQDRPSAAPKAGVWVSDYQITGSAPFSESITAVSSLVFAYAGTPSFFSIAAEMRDPRQYTRSLLICQSVVTGVYLAIGCVVYYYCGSYVASPALGSAGPMLKKISYGFALPGLLVTTMLVIHLPGKYIFLRLLKGSRHLTANTVTHWVVWLSCTFGITLISYIIASAIPVFDNLVSLVGALLGTLMSFQPMGCMWLYDNWSDGKKARSPRWTMMVCWSAFVILSGTFLMISGTYGSIVTIMNSYKTSGGSAAWSCADNSNST
ncbi:transmembrane amino acid transporter protein-domain-containing protein [Penicillium manginii]|uniref:transmembrane amino acid transporter protein-domain-containing protein n=1 Tax=Penicillium manginii TaxID=203109 RepID=UPI002548139B|nr:transmembrane amino acid transporter protein-domain-containing protein [Penicillium manginii]KAJ5744159.1 transmembrane amino acid transporter protein-domain-containing protein [Penicillium manginii]